jgi:hypothetical protein
MKFVVVPAHNVEGPSHLPYAQGVQALFTNVVGLFSFHALRKER